MNQHFIEQRSWYGICFTIPLAITLVEASRGPYTIFPEIAEFHRFFTALRLTGIFRSHVANMP